LFTTITSRALGTKSMPNLSRFLRDLYRCDEFMSTTNLDACKFHNLESQRMINPTCIVPFGHSVDFEDKKGLEGLDKYEFS